MTNDSKAQMDDPMLARLLRHPSGLQAGGFHAQHQVLATYHTRSGETPFAICRDGILLNPAAEARFIPYVEIEDAGYYNRQMVMRAKMANASSAPHSLSIRLRSGETIDLPVDVRVDGISDLLTIAGFLQQWATIHRSEERRGTG